MSRKNRRRSYRPRLERVEDRRLLAADLALNVTDADATVAPGGTVAYQFEYSNIGDEAANGSIRTYVPRHTTLAEEGSTEGWTCEESRWGTACSLDVGEVAPEGSGVATLAVTVNEDLSRWTRQIAIRGTISGDELRDRNDGDWSVTPVVRELSDLQLDMTAVDQSEVAVGGTLVYTLDYANKGVVAAPGAAITVALPENTTLATEGNEGWTCEEGVCTFELGEVAAEATGQATLSVTIDADTPTNVRHIYARARIADDGSGVADANPWNNRGYERVRVVHQVPDLTINLSDGDVESVAAGDSMTYTVEYANAGLVDAAAVTVSVQLPSGVTLADGNTDAWVCEDGVCTLTVGDLAAEAAGSATLHVTIDAELQKTRRISAYASISDDGSAGDDANPRNNWDRERTRVAVEESEDGDRGRFDFGRFFEWIRRGWRSRARG